MSTDVAPVQSMKDSARNGSSLPSTSRFPNELRRGKEARTEVPRSSHAAWQPSPHRPSPLELLEEQAQHTCARSSCRSATGGCLCRPSRSTVVPRTSWPRISPRSPRTGLQVQLCGDAHLSNFGAFAAPDRVLVFSINDFDETLPGPFEWDVKRLVASFAVAGRDRGFSDKRAQRPSTWRSGRATGKRSPVSPK